MMNVECRTPVIGRGLCERSGGLFALALVVSLAWAGDLAAEAPRTCTYRTYAWSVSSKRAVDHRTVTKPRAELSADEKAPDFETSGCTVCREDQVEVQVEGLPAVTVCRHYAEGVREALEAIRGSGRFEVHSLKGYRVGRTRGAVVEGRRTRFSAHSFGTAVDVNAAHNGLYGGCDLGGRVPSGARDVTGCRLRIGGRWDPTVRPDTTLTEGSITVRAFREHVGWRWGGAISGATKDFMHLSPDGR
jgi:hypothetical protein